jgi:hypothetical protein
VPPCPSASPPPPHRRQHFPSLVSSPWVLRACRQVWVIPVVNVDGFIENFNIPQRELRLIRWAAVGPGGLPWVTRTPVTSPPPPSPPPHPPCTPLASPIPHPRVRPALCRFSSRASRSKTIKHPLETCPGNFDSEYKYKGVDLNRNYPTCFEFQNDDNAASGNPCRSVRTHACTYTHVGVAAMVARVPPLPRVPLAPRARHAHQHPPGLTMQTTCMPSRRALTLAPPAPPRPSPPPRTTADPLPPLRSRRRP